MISKPIELTGTALPFAEYVHSRIMESYAPFNYNNLNTLLDFYLQPFEEKMIISYFRDIFLFDYKGQLHRKPIYDQYLFEGMNGDIRIYPAIINEYQFDSTADKRVISGKSKALDTFITLCNNAGVELEWK